MSQSSIFNPFPGLRAFEPDEEHLFFGREEASDELRALLRTQRFVAVVGTSGSGKSSLVRSGLIPSLHGGFMAGSGSSWRIALLRPENRPFDNMARALNDPEILGAGDEELAEVRKHLLETTLRSSSVGLIDATRQANLPEGTNLLVVIDQFEELFRFGPAGENEDSRFEALAFVRLLLETARRREAPVYVVITMRSDFLGECVEFPNLPEAITRGLYLVPRLDRDQLRRAITGPVAVAGGSISNRLVQRLLNEVGDEADQLPVLQHALMRTFDHWQGNNAGSGPVDVDDYVAVGTMKEALSKHAEEAWEELQTEEDRRIAETLFKALTDKMVDDRGLRRPCRIEEIAALARVAPEKVIKVVEHFRSPRRSFIMPLLPAHVVGDTIADISHESLIRCWPRLDRWASEEAGLGHFYQRLARAAERYERDAGGLWREQELRLAEDWEREAEPTAAWAARYDQTFERAMSFLEESRSARKSYLARMRRRRQIRRIAIAAALVLTIGALIAWTVRLARDSQRQQSLIRAGEILDTAASLADPLARALLLAELDPGLEPSGGVRIARRAAEQAIPRAQFRVRPAGEIVAALSPDGSTVAGGAVNSVVKLYAADGTGSPMRIPAPVGSLRDLAFSADGTRLVRLSDHEISVHALSDVATPEIRVQQDELILSAIFEAGSLRFVTISEDERVVRIWSHDDPTGPVDLVAHDGRVLSAVFEPGGERLVTTSEDRTARVWSLAEPHRPIVLNGHGDAVTAAAFSSDGARVVTGSADGTARVWTLPDGAESSFLADHGGGVESVAFSPDGSRVVTGSLDGLARVFPADGSGSPLMLRGHERGVTQVAISSDGGTILSASADGTIRVWNGIGPGEPIMVAQLPGEVLGADFLGQSPHVFTYRGDGATWIWPVDGNQQPVTLRRHGEPVFQAAFAPDGSRIATASLDDTARIWSSDGKEQAVLRGHADDVLNAAFSHDARFVVTASADHTARVWKADGTGEPIVLEGHVAAVELAAFGPDGKRVVTASADGTARVSRADGTGQAIILGGHGGAVKGANFSHDGTRILTTSDDGKARIWPSDGLGDPVILTVPDSWFGTAVFNHADSKILTASSDGAVRIWNVDGTGEPILLGGHTGAVASAAFSPDDSRVITASGDGTVRIWRVGWAELLGYLRDATSVCLTPAQRARYLGEPAATATARFAHCEREYGREPGAE